MQGGRSQPPRTHTTPPSPADAEELEHDPVDLVKDGFLYNDSFVVVNDYDELLSEIGESDISNEASIGDIPKLGFESTLMGMVTALQEIQSKGDQMMNAISDQKKVLVKLRSEVFTTSEEGTR